jgi:hypothetical protein
LQGIDSPLLNKVKRSGSFKVLFDTFPYKTRGERKKVLRSLSLKGLVIAPIKKKDFLDLRHRLSKSEDLVLWDYPYKEYVITYRKPNWPSKGFSFTYEGIKPTSQCTMTDHGKALYHCPSLVRLFPSLFSVSEMRYSYPKVEYVGQCILLNKDRGMKIRPVFNPARLIQAALQPLFDVLEYLGNTFPEYTVDQGVGREWVRYNLPLTSIDLEAASDNVPLSFQGDFMMQFFPQLEKEIMLFCQVSRMNWRSKFSDIDICFKRGQPLGLLPSFYAFSVPIMMILRYHFLGPVKMFNPRIRAPFVIVGDDICTKDGYHIVQLLVSLKFKINIQKTIFDQDFASFGGQTIDCQGPLGVYKLRPLNYKWQLPLDVLKLYGLSLSKKYSGYSAEFLYFAASLPEPYGLGMNLVPISDGVYGELFKETIQYETENPKVEETFDCFIALEGGLDEQPNHPLALIMGQFVNEYQDVSLFHFTSHEEVFIAESLNKCEPEYHYKHALIIQRLLFPMRRITVRKRTIGLPVVNKDNFPLRFLKNLFQLNKLLMKEPTMPQILLVTVLCLSLIACSSRIGIHLSPISSSHTSVNPYKLTSVKPNPSIDVEKLKAKYEGLSSHIGRFCNRSIEIVTCREDLGKGQIKVCKRTLDSSDLCPKGFPSFERYKSYFSWPEVPKELKSQGRPTKWCRLDPISYDTSPFNSIKESSPKWATVSCNLDTLVEQMRRLMHK